MGQPGLVGTLRGLALCFEGRRFREGCESLTPGTSQSKERATLSLGGFLVTRATHRLAALLSQEGESTNHRMLGESRPTDLRR